jgi:hypothetical protein
VDKFIVYVSDKEGTDSASDFEDCSNRHGFWNDMNCCMLYFEINVTKILKLNKYMKNSIN